MNTPTTPEVCPGWFGKIPSLGDFATRRLPPTFVKPWDQWLSAELPEARFFLADAWSAIYQQAPISCFSLGLGTLGDQAWHGILVPSFDRVGRQFPLTIALGRPRYTPATMARRWWAALVASARRALEPACGADGVDQALSVFTAEFALAAEPALAAVPVPGMEPAPAILDEGMSMWWAWSAVDPSDPVLTIVPGLPRGACFRKLLGAG
jgi:type VI secretion system protein ImpM